MKFRRRLSIFSYLLLGSFIFDLAFSGSFFNQFSLYISMGGTIYLTFLIFIYYLDLLKSKGILTFYRSLPFYISVGLLIWHLVVTPLFIYSRFFSLSSPDFVALHSFILKVANIFLYGILITGFVFCSGKGEKMEVNGNLIKG